MPKAQGLMLGVRGGGETKIPIRLVLNKEEKELFGKYLQMSGGTPSEIVTLAIKRILKTDKYFNSKKDEVVVSSDVLKMISPKGIKKPTLNLKK